MAIAAPGRGLCPAIRDDVLEVARGDRPRRQQTKYHRGQRRQSQREEEDGKAKAHLLGARDRARCEQTLCAIGEKKPEGAANERQHEAFGNELAHEPPAPGAERSLDPELVSARVAFRELQIRDVGAGDEEHRNHGTKENDEAGARVPHDGAFERRDIHAASRVGFGIFLFEPRGDPDELDLGG